MQIHIFTNESFYSTSLIQLLEKKLDLKEHLFIFRKKNSIFQSYSNEVSSKIIYAPDSLSMFILVVPLLVKSNWIYFHYLPYGPSLLFWALTPSLIKKSTWIIWGGDVFIYKEKNRNTTTRLYEFLRRKIIPKFPEIASFIEKDSREAMSVYGSKAEYIKILYPIPLDITLLKSKTVREVHFSTNILIGNSADPSNFHLEIIEILSRFCNESIKIFCPLSYYSDDIYIKKVIQLGKYYFADKFIPLTHIMSPLDYSTFLADIDVGIMNHRRQQALGNILPLLFLGKKVFLRSDISTYGFLIIEGCNVFDLESISNSSFEEFIFMSKEFKLNNSSLIEKITSDKYCSSLWLNLLNKHNND